MKSIFSASNFSSLEHNQPHCVPLTMTSMERLGYNICDTFAAHAGLVYNVTGMVGLALAFMPLSPVFNEQDEKPGNNFLCVWLLFSFFFRSSQVQGLLLQFGYPLN